MSSTSLKASTQQTTSQPKLRNPDEPYDVHKSYLSYLVAPKSLPPALAAISALTDALPLHQITTASEAVSLLSSLSNALKSQLKNPVPASAGTDIFLRYLVTTVVKTSAGSFDIEQAIQNVAKVGEAFVRKGLKARKDIEKYGKRIISDGSTVIVPTADYLVKGLLIDAAESDIDFRVVFVDGGADKSQNLKETLEKQQIECASINPEALAHTMTLLLTGKGFRETIMLTGASALLATGGVLAPMGTFQAAALAKLQGIQVHVVSETSKAVRWMSLDGHAASYGRALQWSHGQNSDLSKDLPSGPDPEAMDVTPPEYISSIITEYGPLSPNAIAEDSIKTWF